MDITMTQLEQLKKVFTQIGLTCIQTSWKEDKVLVVANNVNFNFDEEGKFKEVKVWKDK